MWTPRINDWKNDEEIFQFMKDHSFALVVSETGHQPTATHLPVIVDQVENEITITTHLAKANPHWKYLDQGRVLVVFSNPHSYISPTLYDHQQNVPTWNYISVHAYGTVNITFNHDELLEILNKTISKYEENYKQQWQRLNTDYVKAMLDDIVGVTITVDQIEAKEKISQNKSKVEQERIANHLIHSEKTNEREVGMRMKKRIK